MALAPAPVQAQRALPAAFGNPGMEQVDENGRPAGWHFVAQPDGQGQQLVLDSNDPREGSVAAAIDTTAGMNQFTNLMQSFAAAPFQEKQVRFRAAVRTADLSTRTRVQLWFRVDRVSPSGEEIMGAFDNMQARPIRGGEWSHYEIVLPVAADASVLNVGMFIIGKGRAWIDDASVEIVPDDTPSTAMSLETRVSQIPREVWEAAAKAPQQPFFTPWLWLVLVTVTLFVVSQLDPARAMEEQRPARPIVKAALRFSVVYWILYNFPAPFSALGLGPLFGLHASAENAVVRWTASTILGIERELVAPNGSGDTTYAYVQVLLCFVGALVVGGLWSLLHRRRTDDRMLQDLLRTYLRYVLAFTLISYGLAKIGTVMNQFPVPGVLQLNKTYGESSPMNLIWTFMGASRPYTTFSGLGELIGGVLLLWRRTTTLGALVSFGVMLNVVMLNFCYDVPVKQYSAHLACMAAFLLLPDAKRLANVLVLNRPTQAVEHALPFTGRRVLLALRALKVAVLVVGLALPIGSKIWTEIHDAPSPEEIAEREREQADYLLMSRGFRWINEVPFNR